MVLHQKMSSKMFFLAAVGKLKLVTLRLIMYRKNKKKSSRITFKSLDLSMVMCITLHLTDVGQYGLIRLVNVGISAIRWNGDIVGQDTLKQHILVSVAKLVHPTAPMRLPIHGDTGTQTLGYGLTQIKDSVSGAHYKIMKNSLSFSPVLFSFTQH